MKSIDDLKRETRSLFREEHEARRDRRARDARNGLILDAYDRISDGRAPASEATPPPRHPPRLALVPNKETTMPPVPLTGSDGDRPITDEPPPSTDPAL